MLALEGVRLLRLSARTACGAAFLRKSPPPAAHSDSSARRQLSSGDAASGWYHQVSHSAPVHLAEDFLVHVQQASGLPWWLSIAVSTLSIRTLVTLPLAAYQLLIIGKVEALQLEISELAKRLRYEVSLRAKERGWTEKQSRFQFRKNLRRLVSQLYVRDNCHPFKASLLVWVQLPLWISLSLALRNLSLEESDLFPPEVQNLFSLQVCDQRHARLLLAHDPHRHHRPLVHGTLLVLLQPGGALSQSAPSFPCPPQAPQSSYTTLQHAIQGPPRRFYQQVSQVNRKSNVGCWTSRGLVDPSQNFISCPLHLFQQQTIKINFDPQTFPVFLMRNFFFSLWDKLVVSIVAHGQHCVYLCSTCMCVTTVTDFRAQTEESSGPASLPC
ncbi:uncharacterized protein LOC129189930 isoform X1 [Dunckerocampus dactyliophorus]|uniref:uncharacterized protein LOC129189930 isoform X1 n=1 Tax=Dunckerocampus dactyliophorus TaxID=161453 RepID=UPI002406E253|nr:uncharacterized protein LOC129189930 isoform X1 [Dunckerocampus dactyliophorus]XP_054648101.1 uncharacterized protein LOC129189930 isoform X1 [Dunckerocampus dactyliophorus]XP_054648102.1 uncharacterized protein LOC129189930 isoform X1 [Dunckerocampus dactyliophorus]